MRDFNNFTISGFVVRVTPITNGKIFSIANNKDYMNQTSKEWVKQCDYLPAAFFTDKNAEVGDYVIISGEVGTRKNDQGESLLTLKGLSMVRTPASRNEKDGEDAPAKTEKPAAKATSPKSKWVSKKDASDEDGDAEKPW